MGKMQKNSLVSVEIDDLAYGGLGVGRLDGFVVFVKHGLPGDRLQVRILKKKQNHAQARIERIERPSPDRIAEPPCPVFGLCGGCTWQNLPYEVQLRWKQKQVADTIEHLGGQSDFEVRPIIPSPEPWRYRNKMEFSFGQDEQGETILGFHRPGRFDRILAIDACLLQPPPLDAILRELTAHARRLRLSGYDPRRHEGFLRHAVLRHSATRDESVLVLITNEGELPEKEALAERLRAAAPGFKGMIWAIHTGVADVARVERERWRWGDLTLNEQLNDLDFELSPQSFFQTNTAGARALYENVVELADLGPRDRVLDAYCGAGAIGLHCARAVERVVGVDSVRESIWNARANARRNGIDNAVFLAGAMPGALALARRASVGSFTRVIIDPPRGGMDKRSLQGLIKLRAPLFIYVSCNPSTLARDLATLAEAGYAIETVQPIDLFPQTYHVEAIVRLRLDAGLANFTG